MNPLYNHYIIDMSSNNNFVQVPTMEGDGNGVRGFEIELIANGYPYIIDKENTIVSIMGTKPDTKQIMNPCVITDEGYILVDITSQMSAVNGRGDYCIALMDVNTNSRLTSFPFFTITTSAPYNISEIVSSDEFQLLTKTVVDASSVSLKAQERIDIMEDLEAEVSANEAVRVTNESERIQNENERKEDELLRVAEEKVRISNEDERISAEDTRIYNESERVEAETIRLSSETIRVENEDSRLEAENIRKENENIRVTNESERISTEESRVNSENTRVTNEKERIQNESNRQSAETNRESTVATAISNANTAAQNANDVAQDAIDAIVATETATDNANTATQNANTAITEMKALMKDESIVHKADCGIPSGVATLDENGFIPASQLPSFVNDVLDGKYDADNDTFLDLDGNEYAPESGKIYIDTSSRVTYRWSGTTYVSIGSALALGTTSSTAYAGDKGVALENRVTDIEEYHNNIPAEDIKFNNANTSILSANVQDAIVELTETATTTKDGLLSAEDKKLIDNYANIVTYEITLLSAKWTGNSAPYAQIVTVDGLGNYNNCNVVLSDNATVEQETAITNAEISDITYDANVGLTFIASGEKPLVDIPLLLKAGASMNVVEVPKYLGEVNIASNVSFDSSSSDLNSTNVQDAIDNTNNKIGLLSSLTTTVKTSIVNAINSIVTSLNSLSSKLGSADISSVGNTCTDAINALDKKVINNIAAIRELDINVATNTTAISGLNNAIVPQVCKTITDWNSATTNGWYMGSSVINAPTNGWYFGRTIVHNANYVLQEVWGFTFSSDARKIPKYIRIRMNGTWSPWVQETLITASLSGTTLTIDI